MGIKLFTSQESSDKIDPLLVHSVDKGHLIAAGFMIIEDKKLPILRCVKCGTEFCVSDRGTWVKF